MIWFSIYLGQNRTGGPLVWKCSPCYGIWLVLVIQGIGDYSRDLELVTEVMQDPCSKYHAIRGISRGLHDIMGHLWNTHVIIDSIRVFCHRTGTPFAYMGICGTYMGICETYLGILYRCEKPGTYNSMVLYDIAYFEL